jgi:hypothetical protein
MRRERKAARIIWAVDVIVVLVLGVVLFNYFRTPVDTASGGIEEYKPSDGAIRPDDGGGLGPLSQYISDMKPYLPKDVFTPPPKEQPLSTYIQVTAIFMGQDPPKCQVTQTQQYKGKTLTKSLYAVGDDLFDGLVKVSEIKENGVLFEVNGEKILIELKP